MSEPKFDILRTVLRSQNLKINEQHLIDDEVYIYDYDLQRPLTREEISNGVIFEYK